MVRKFPTNARFSRSKTEFPEVDGDGEPHVPLAKTTAVVTDTDMRVLRGIRKVAGTGKDGR
jgi:hypothetical protein